MTRTWMRGLLLAAATGALACSGGDEMDMAADTGMGAAQMGRASSSAMPAEGVEYTVVFHNAWTRASHPTDYPTAGAVSGPHFSGIIGATHDSTYRLFAEGTMPSPGLERLSEEGKHSPLDEEIRAAMAARNVGMLFTTGPLRDLGDSLVTTVKVDAAHPLVSLVAMIAPSPDWFAGAANVSLMDGGQWVATRSVDLMAYDSGGDDGTTYKAPDMDANPKHATMMASPRHFSARGMATPVARVTFTRK